jgi:type III secretion protein V
VGARFTLDALPGKQLGIDADLRTGAIDAEQAQQRRRHLSRESQFYGAMDGAMKFVKGDVIASILIAGVNIIGGLAIGVGQRDLSFSDALRRYALLTIGNGLVTQIPALILATSAGVLVTRVASENAEQSLGAELGAQLLGEPRALFAASLFVVGLGLVPGLPLPPFAAIGLILFFASRARAGHLAKRLPRQALQPVLRPQRADESLRFVPLIVPWALKVGVLNRLAPGTPSPRDGSPAMPKKRHKQGAGSKNQPHQQREVLEALRVATDQVREQLFLETGVPVPECVIDIDARLAPGQALLLIHEVVRHEFALAPSGLSELTGPLVAQLGPVLRQRATEFLGMSETQQLLGALERVAPETVRQVVPKGVTLSALTDILRRLVEEGVCIRDLSSILQALGQASAHERDPHALTEAVRAELRRSTTHQLTAGASHLGVVLLDPSLEEVVRAAISSSASGKFLALAPSAASDIVTAVQRALEEASGKQTSPAVLLTAPDTRRFVRTLLQAKLPEVRVISPAELLPDVAIETLAVATVAGI